MIRRIFFGIGWCIVLWLAAWLITGMVAGAIVGFQSQELPPELVMRAAAQASAQARASLDGYIFVGAVILSALGTWVGIFPGTRAKSSTKPIQQQGDQTSDVGNRPIKEPNVGWKGTASIGISTLAFFVSTAGFYYQSVYERSELSMQLMGFTMKAQDSSTPACEVDLVLFNSGNRDAALVRSYLAQEKTMYTSTSSHTESKTYFPDVKSAESTLPGYLARVIKAGEVRFLALVFPGCDPNSLKSSIALKGLDEFKLVTKALNFRGERSIVSTSFATADISDDGRMIFTLHLNGKFDLLTDRASYDGQSFMEQRKLWIKKMVKNGHGATILRGATRRVHY